ncbi:serine hydrolase domain-containing protein [Mesorhizobium sp. 1B3]|uniref:serine hydrolase domain-containing protein n=1 Tax=Mesorhizobium sp. 1B3 TaxID=3243599 RepID=UPI003D97510D
MNREAYINSLFRGADQRLNFQSLDTIFPVGRMSASPRPFLFARGEAMTLPSEYRHDGQRRSIEALLYETETMALLVLKDGELVFERYAPWGGPDRRWKSMSVAKSVISAALGIAVGERLIASIEESISSYLPELEGSAYDGVRIKDVLQMSSGAGWNEDYSDPNSDINRFAEITARGGSFNAFPATLKRAREPGTYNLYNSTDTQVLGMLLTRITERPIHAYVQEKLWHPLGMEAEGYWLLDDTGMEMAYAGLNATARDYLKIGELFRSGGSWEGRQLVPSECRAIAYE